VHNSKPHRPGSRTHKQSSVIDKALYIYKKYSPDFIVQPGDKVQYMDEDGSVLAGTVLADGSYCLNNIDYVRVEFADGIEAIAVGNLISLPPLFDYSTLSSESRIVVMQKTSEIKTLMRRAAQDIIDIGTKLIEVKDQLGHGNFGNWLNAEFGWSHDTAGRYMNVSRAFIQIPHGAEFQAKALYLLSAPSTPDEAREEALEIAKSGEPITYATAKAIVAQHKPTEPPRQPPPLPPVPAAPPARVFAPVPSTPVRYSPPQDDYVEEFPAVQVDASPEEEAYVVVESPDAVPYQEEPLLLMVGDKVKTIHGRLGGLVIGVDERDAYRTHVKFGDSEAYWTDAHWLALVERPEAQPEPAAPAVATYAHHRSTSNEWYTPVEYVNAAREVMAGITLDPASCEYANKVVRAAMYYDIDTNGLLQPWEGSVFLHPPYGLDDNGDSNVATWVAKLISEFNGGKVKEAILLVNATPERKWFQPLWQYPVCFTDHRIQFYNANGQSNQPTQGNAFVYLGPHKLTFAAIFAEFGTVVSRMGV